MDADSDCACLLATSNSMSLNFSAAETRPASKTRKSCLRHVKARDRMAMQRWERLNKERKAWLEAPNLALSTPKAAKAKRGALMEILPAPWEALDDDD